MNELYHHVPLSICTRFGLCMSAFKALLQIHFYLMGSLMVWYRNFPTVGLLKEYLILNCGIGFDQEKHSNMGHSKISLK